MLSIFIAHSSPIVTKGLEELLKNRCQVVGTEFDGKLGLNFILKNEPNIAILDINLPSLMGIEIADKCDKLKISTKIILITSNKEVELYLEAIERSTYGCLLKESSLMEIEKCIDSVSKNVPFFGKEVEKSLASNKESIEKLRKLTLSEMRILKLISKHKTSIEIGKLLFLSPRTIHKHRSNIIKKLDLKPKNRSLNMWVENNKHLLD